jgi:type VI secretion system protein VasG
MIIELKLGKVARRTSDHYRAKLTYTPELVDTICARCTEVDTGARNVDHILRRTLLPEMSSEFLSRMAEGGTIEKVNISVSDDGSFQYSIQ